MKSFILLSVGFACFSAFTWSVNAFDGLNEGSKLHIVESVLQFAVNVKELEKSCVESPEFELRNITWKVKACLNHDIFNSSKTALDMILETPFKDDTINWISETEAQFKLLHKNEEKTIVKDVEKRGFNKTESTHKIENFVTRDELLEEFVENDEAIIEIIISTKKLKHVPRLVTKASTFEFTIKNLSQLKRQFSDEVVVQGIRWRALANNFNGFLGVYIYPNLDDLGIQSNWIVSATFTITSKDGTPHSRTFSDVKFDVSVTNWGFSNFIAWSELFDKEFVVNDAVILRVQIKVEEKTTN